ncbi:MAG: dephospho-CoA kinase [Chlamydiae bacterium RIFCSPHIGHO2_12_FULL_49_11]|nr:MAG: dephospho-CoA kinase [Chlamydiae bacterium RIFCSPHIGHO2_12_FULL_49_11]
MTKGSCPLRKIAITGNIGAGKSTFLHSLENLGCYAVSSDDLVHQALNENRLIQKKIGETFGKDVLNPDNTMNKLALAEKVFQDIRKIKVLEGLLHPHVMKELQKIYKHLSPAEHKAFVVEIPLLFEGGFEDWFDTVILLTAPLSIRRRRCIARGFSESDFALREKRFIPDHAKIDKCEFVIENGSNPQQLQKQALRVAKELSL